MTAPVVLKFGGELLEDPARMHAVVSAVAAMSAAGTPLVIVHGGGREIDAALKVAGIEKRQVEGLRITDDATLDVVVSVLGGSANTELVAALVEGGVAAVGLTGVDAGLGRANRVAAHRSTTGAIVDLGLVGDAADVDASLIELLLVHGYVPVVASLGLDAHPSTGVQNILNVNADVMACRLAAALEGSDLVIAGATAGVLDDQSEPIPALDAAGVDSLIARGTATAGMVAKLSACRSALVEGVASVRIVDGRQLDATHGVEDALGTTLILSLDAVRRQTA